MNILKIYKNNSNLLHFRKFIMEKIIFVISIASVFISSSAEQNNRPIIGKNQVRANPLVRPDG